MGMNELRQEIDRIDEQMIRLFTERMDVATRIGQYKKENNLPVLDLSREKEKILNVIDQSPEHLKEFTPLLFSLLFEISRNQQSRLCGLDGEIASAIKKSIETTPQIFPDNVSVACQGIAGANSQAACEKLFRYPRTFFCSSFEAVFSAIENGLCAYGVIPLENSSAGSVNLVYDQMMRRHFYIVRSIRLKISHNLLAKPGVKLENIREIYSHEQALNQCSVYLSKLKNVRVIPCENTAVAARMVAESDRDDIAAIASEQCIKQYGLNCLEESIQNVDNNYTRFICIAKNLEIYPGANRTSLMMTLPHEQGSLFKVLSKFYSLGINLNKLESRPLPNKEFEFMFYFDLDTPVYSPNLLQVIEELKTSCDFFQYLGSYSEVI